EGDPAEEKPPDEAKAEDAPETPETPDGKDDDDKAEKPAENSAENPAEKSAKKKRKKPVSLIPKEHLADRILEAAEGLTDKIEAVKLLIDLVWDDLIKLIKKVYFTGLVIDFTAADEDAAAAAISYGRMNAVVYDAIATVKVLTRLDVKSVRIDCLYDTPKDKAQYNGEITLRLRPASLVNAVFAVLFRFLFHIKKYKPILDTFLKK
ncbi:MAG: hypothetical protein ILP19_04135, partial [Oscillospiraceae bacterium]|nr:hypothetical protein [Oscillospiraceae bacterium]